jgi:hypothetical protein
LMKTEIKSQIRAIRTRTAILSRIALSDAGSWYRVLGGTPEECPFQTTSGDDAEFGGFVSVRPSRRCRGIAGKSNS